MPTGVALPLLELIAQKEQELRVRLLAARAESEALLARARHEAAETHAQGLAAAAAEARSWLGQQLEQAQGDAQRTTDVARAQLRESKGDPRRVDDAAQLVLDAVLLHARPTPAREVRSVASARAPVEPTAESG